LKFVVGTPRSFCSERGDPGKITRLVSGVSTSGKRSTMKGKLQLLGIGAAMVLAFLVPSHAVASTPNTLAIRVHIVGYIVVRR
jgi:hypothetical protein